VYIGVHHGGAGPKSKNTGERVFYYVGPPGRWTTTATWEALPYVTSRNTKTAAAGAKAPEGGGHQAGKNPACRETHHFGEITAEKVKVGNMALYTKEDR